MGYPLQLKFYSNDNYIGYAKIQWNDNFLDLIGLSITVDNVQPAKLEDQFKIYSGVDKIIGTVDIFMRLSTFGEKIETLYYMEDIETSSNYMFMNPNSSKIFKCSK